MAPMIIITNNPLTTPPSTDALLASCGQPAGDGRPCREVSLQRLDDRGGVPVGASAADDELVLVDHEAGDEPPRRLDDFFIRLRAGWRRFVQRLTGIRPLDLSDFPEFEPAQVEEVLAVLHDSPNYRRLWEVLLSQEGLSNAMGEMIRILHRPLAKQAFGLPDNAVVKLPPDHPRRRVLALHPRPTLPPLVINEKSLLRSAMNEKASELASLMNPPAATADGTGPAFHPTPA